MKKTFQIMDLFFIIIFCSVFMGLFLSKATMQAYESMISSNPFFVGFLQFSLLATFGESLAQRIAFGTYIPKNYGLFPKAILWGFLGMIITAVFTIFSNGAPFVLNKLGFLWGSTALGGPFGIEKIAAAFITSIALNTIFAPFLMLSHNLIYTHVKEFNGSSKCLISKPDIVKYLQILDWEQFWKLSLVRNFFIFCPMHTLTFLLPENFRVLFAAFLGACLGLILTSIRIKSKSS